MASAAWRSAADAAPSGSWHGWVKGPQAQCAGAGPVTVVGAAPHAEPPAGWGLVTSPSAESDQTVDSGSGSGSGAAPSAYQQQPFAYQHQPFPYEQQQWAAAGGGGGAAAKPPPSPPASRAASGVLSLPWRALRSLSGLLPRAEDLDGITGLPTTHQEAAQMVLEREQQKQAVLDSAVFTGCI